eukprot:4112339-Lingulodinium_polyedra.AAC.1
MRNPSAPSRPGPTAHSEGREAQPSGRAGAAPRRHGAGGALPPNPASWLGMRPDPRTVAGDGGACSDE